MRKILGLMAAVSLLVFVLGAGTALATHKDGHQRPPACDTSKGSAPQNNKHCYPVAAGPVTEAGGGPSPEAGALQGSSQSGGGFTIGMAAAGAAGLLVGSLLLRWRWTRARSRRPKLSGA